MASSILPVSYYACEWIRASDAHACVPVWRASFSGVLTYVLSIACHSWLSCVFWRHMSEIHHPALLPCWSYTVRRAGHSAFNAHDCVCELTASKLYSEACVHGRAAWERTLLLAFSIGRVHRTRALPPSFIVKRAAECEPMTASFKLSCIRPATRRHATPERRHVSPLLCNGRSLFSSASPTMRIQKRSLDAR